MAADSDAPDTRKLIWSVSAVIALVFVVGMGALSSCGGRDDEAYRSGQQSASMAEMLLKAGEGLDDGGADTPREACEVVYDTSDHTRDMDRNDWIDGCTDQIRDHPGASPFDLDGPPMTSTAVASKPSRPVYTQTSTPVPPTTESEFSPSSRAVLAAQVGDCLQRIQGDPNPNGTFGVYIYSADCDVPLATHKVARIVFGSQSQCDDVWVRSTDVQPPKVLCLQPLK